MHEREIEDDLPILLFYYGDVVKALEQNAIRTRRIVPRKEALDMFLRTRNFREVAEHFDVSQSANRWRVNCDLAAFFRSASAAAHSRGRSLSRTRCVRAVTSVLT